MAFKYYNCFGDKIKPAKHLRNEKNPETIQESISLDRQNIVAYVERGKYTQKVAKGMTLDYSRHLLYEKIIKDILGGL